jgi:hypothetical protein
MKLNIAGFPVLVSLAASLVIAGTSIVFGQSDPARRSIDDLEWMAGFWHGDALGGYSEEVWTGPIGGTMTGVFRLVVEEKTRVLEFLVIEETEAGIIYRFKHYNSAMVPWEEDPLVFHLVSLEGSRAVFEAPKKVTDTPRRLIYHLRDDGKLSVRVEGWEEKNGEAEAFELVLDRKATPGPDAEEVKKKS